MVEILGVYGLPVEEAVITAGRETGPDNEKTWGIRPKMRVVFSVETGGSDAEEISASKVIDAIDAVKFISTAEKLQEGQQTNVLAMALSSSSGYNSTLGGTLSGVENNSTLLVSDSSARRRSRSPLKALGNSGMVTGKPTLSRTNSGASLASAGGIIPASSQITSKWRQKRMSTQDQQSSGGGIGGGGGSNKFSNMKNLINKASKNASNARNTSKESSKNADTPHTRYRNNKSKALASDVDDDMLDLSLEIGSDFEITDDEDYIPSTGYKRDLRGSYSELKYKTPLVRNKIWEERWILERPKWKDTNFTWRDFNDLRTFRVCESKKTREKLGRNGRSRSRGRSFSPLKYTTSKGERSLSPFDGRSLSPNFSGKLLEFDFYPCSFLLKEGITHRELTLQLELTLNDSVSSSNLQKNQLKLKNIVKKANSAANCPTKPNNGEQNPTSVLVAPQAALTNPSQPAKDLSSLPPHLTTAIQAFDFENPVPTASEALQNTFMTTTNAIESSAQSALASTNITSLATLDRGNSLSPTNADTLYSNIVVSDGEFHWDTWESYDGLMSRAALLRRIKTMKKEGLRLDNPTKDLENRLENWVNSEEFAKEAERDREEFLSMGRAG